MSDSFKFLDFTNSEITDIVIQQLKNSYAFCNSRKQVRDEIKKSNPKSYELGELVPKIMKDMSLENDIKKNVYDIFSQNYNFKNDVPTMIQKKLINCESLAFLPDYFTKKYHEPLEAVAAGRKSWNEMMKIKYVMAVKNTKKPFVRGRKERAASASDASTKDSQQRLETASKPDEEVVVKCIYESSHIFDTILKLNSPNYSGNILLSWGCIRLQLETRSIDELRKKFAELNVTLRQIGVDDDKAFVEERILIGEKLLQKEYAPYLRQYAKRGVPPSLRNRVYKRLFDIEMSQKDLDYFESLQEQFHKWEYAIDDILAYDLREVLNDDKYFIFEELLESAVYCFFRDPWVANNLAQKPHDDFIGIAGTDRNIGNIPACGVLPCEFFSRYGAPLCYISEKCEDVYYIFRGLYTKYFCCLNTISSKRQSILGLSKLFEDLLQTYEPEMCYHLDQIGVNPLKIAFPWIFYAFSGYMEVDQIFLIWDRILGFDGLEILAIMAAAIFFFRANLILNCNTLEEVEELFLDLSYIKVVPLLQHFMFAVGIN